MVAGKGWRVPSWRVVGVVAGAELPGREARGTPIRSDADEEHFLWGGLRARAVPRRRRELLGEPHRQPPSLYVLCSEDDQGALVPEGGHRRPRRGLLGRRSKRPRVFGADPARGVPAPRSLRRGTPRAAGEAQAQALGLVGARGIMSERDSARRRPATRSDESFLGRWSRLKAAGARARSRSPVAGPRYRCPDAPRAAPATSQASADAPPPVVELPDLEQLDQDSDYSAFLTPGVDAALRQRALRKLFSSPKFNVFDGLDTYRDDFRNFHSARRHRDRGHAPPSRADRAGSPSAIRTTRRHGASPPPRRRRSACRTTTRRNARRPCPLTRTEDDDDHRPA